ncbi:hypothetical protein HanRHA438_Chr11g0512801 [Helianthus annuus]|uniref:Uncharacterized protein n=1 Tax=Helianthus annuus TaxID=4232 RepID=A0A9K3HRE8_HELAN|nr:hypothetical protein HanXRQr2_Chr11g0500071 [Helianthus annuus]KAJ0510227.1 hypothetical protein HanIR_Chr11g0538341 [Helianthus annuus]KAJ0518155.1 hypothetical protein HanHA89_Chr11g0434141 [Helianthus annuus]KAJ0686184.1 hypothetical protein HanLR1_Chr11g0411771 [Helianthus annuus]KAJ0690022.1 hypothetical protein HanOQP8_Chr11g0413051 [Helianthus annuus]
MPPGPVNLLNLGVSLIDPLWLPCLSMPFRFPTFLSGKLLNPQWWGTLKLPRIS